MALDNGTVLGPYEILSPLGAGGMGEVYRARDTKLDREVAIKVLPDRICATSFSLNDGKVSVRQGADDGRLAKLESEARLLASLNHSNVATLYGFETEGDVSYLVLEMVEGITLGEKLKQGPLRIREALRLFIQIAEGIEAAHERGIAHCDLKPQNIMVTPRGTVKILDFGVARALSPASPTDVVDPTEAPTLPEMNLGNASHTGTGTIVYMSPEQARGQRGDLRADIWAFGCCLYESLAGRRAFAGDTVSDIIVQILEHDPDLERLPADTSRRIRDLLRHCLNKEPTERLRNIGDAALTLRDVLAGPEDEAFVALPEATESPSWRRSLPALAGGLALGLATAWLLLPRADAPREGVRRLSINLPVEHPLQPSLPISPHRAMALSNDGQLLVWVARSGETTQLFKRRLDSVEAQPIEGTEGAWYPFFSPDDRWVGFFDRQNRSLEKVALSGGLPEVLSGLVPSGVAGNTAGLGGTWLTDGTIVYSPAAGPGLLRISENGGESIPFSPPEGSQLYRGFPFALPGNRGVLVMFGDSVGLGRTQVGYVDLTSGDLIPLYERASMPVYVPTGHIVFSQQGQLMAAPFDLDSASATGPPVRITEAAMHRGVGDIWEWTFSPTGTMIYATANDTLGTGREALWVDRSGTPFALGTLGVAGGDWARLSPEGDRVVYGSVDEGGNWDIYLYDIQTDSNRRLTVDPGLDTTPIFHPDGQRVFFSAVRPQGRYLFELDLENGRTAQIGDEPLGFPRSFSADGETLFFEQQADAESKENFGSYSLADGSHRVLMATPSAERYPTLSPDGRWLAYESDQSGRDEIYVQPYPALDAPRQLSENGGNFPLWNAAGTELYFRRGRALLALPVALDEVASFGQPKVLLESDFGVQNDAFDVTRDGSNFLMLSPAARGIPELVVVENWFSELERLAPLP